MGKPLLDAILGVLIPPLQVYLKKRKCNDDFWIDLILILLFPISIIYCFHVCYGMDIIHNICCLFIPPLGVYYSQKKLTIDTLIALILMIFFLLPGSIFAYYKY